MLQALFTRSTAVLLVVAATALAQGPAPAGAPLEFEVASIKPSGPLDVAAIVSGKAHVGMTVDKARVDIGSANLMGLICQAYKVKTGQVAGAPSWMSIGLQADRFDIVAKLPEGATKEQVPAMLQALLADRFKLKVHRETRETPVYALIVGKGGPKLKEVADEPAPVNPPEGAAAEPADPKPPAPPAKGEIVMGSGDSQVRMKQSNGGMVVSSKETGDMHVAMDNGIIRMTFEKASIEMLIGAITQYLDRPIVDLTGLKGKYQAEVEMSLAETLRLAQKMGMNVPMNAPANANASPADAASDPSGSTLFTSVQRLGLKFDPQKLPYEFLVIDHVERTPTEN
jgi:uncharacterized protein (TIGR03435 family)